jgi:hypothetical protein
MSKHYLVASATTACGIIAGSLSSRQLLPPTSLTSRGPSVRGSSLKSTAMNGCPASRRRLRSTTRRGSALRGGFQGKNRSRYARGSSRRPGGRRVSKYPFVNSGDHRVDLPPDSVVLGSALLMPSPRGRLDLPRVRRGADPPRGRGRERHPRLSIDAAVDQSARDPFQEQRPLGKSAPARS